MAGDVALVFIYNHRFDRNVELLERLYGPRFTHIYHLMPFYDGARENVIPVYESSLYFQGYISQGLRSFFRHDYRHYLFVADDLFLNPEINESNYKAFFQVDDAASFIPGFVVFEHRRDFWPRTAEAYRYSAIGTGSEVDHQLPPPEEAARRLKERRVYTDSLEFDQIFPERRCGRRVRELRQYLSWIVRRARAKATGQRFRLGYPLVGGYADIALISSAVIRPFAHLCGVFAAARLHVEIALATSLALCPGDIVTQEEIPLIGRALWHADEYRELDRFKNDLRTLISEFPKNYLYIHPIKFSRWDTSSL